MRSKTRYFLTDDIKSQDFYEVTKEKFVEVERECGFQNTLGQPNEPATVGFSAGKTGGRVVVDYSS